MPDHSRERRSRQMRAVAAGRQTTEDMGLPHLAQRCGVCRPRKTMVWHHLTAIFIWSYIHHMEVRCSSPDEFECWWSSLSIEEQESVTYSVDLLARLGIELKFPILPASPGSRYAHMRTIAHTAPGRPYGSCTRSTRANAVLLIGATDRETNSGMRPSCLWRTASTNGT